MLAIEAISLQDPPGAEIDPEESRLFLGERRHGRPQDAALAVDGHAEHAPGKVFRERTRIATASTDVNPFLANAADEEPSASRVMCQTLRDETRFRNRECLGRRADRLPVAAKRLGD